MKKIFYLIFSLITIFSCRQGQPRVMNSSNKIDTVFNQSANKSLTGKQGSDIWQIDYYPDSLLINKSINDNSGWGSDYAYNIQFSKNRDSCQFIGWHESWENKVIKIDDKNFKIKDSDYQYWEIKLVTENKILMRNIYNKSSYRSKEDTGAFIPYHKVKNILTLDSLNKLVSAKVFAGAYQVLFNDTLTCNNIVEFDKNFGVKGIKGISSYSFETAIDWDFPVFNAFGFNKKGETGNNGLSFKFSGDTLLIKDYKLIQKGGDFDHVEISKTRIKMLKKSF